MQISLKKAKWGFWLISAGQKVGSIVVFTENRGFQVNDTRIESGQVIGPGTIGKFSTLSEASSFASSYFRDLLLP